MLSLRQHNGVPLIVGAYCFESFQSVVLGPGRQQLSPCLEETADFQAAEEPELHRQNSTQMRVVN